MKITGRNILIGLVILVVALIIWNDPSGAGTTASNWMDNIGSWFQDAFDVLNEFAEGVAE